MKNRALPGKRRILFLFTLLCSAIAGVQVINAATITVTNTNDSGPGSLRQALAIAQNGDTIDFSVTGTITLISGPLSVPESKAINIDGPGANALAINGNATTFLFGLGSGTVSISDLTLTNGRNINSDGGAIRMGTRSRLTLTNCIISNNRAGFRGGAIYVTGENDCSLLQYETNLTLNYCTLSGNSAGRDGGAISNTPVAGSCGHTTVTINNCTISDNDAYLEGGGFFNSSNRSPRVGLNYGLARLMINNSTISGNHANLGGGGIENKVSIGDWGAAELTVKNSTFSDNDAPVGADISNDGRRATVAIGHTILDGRGTIYAPNDGITSLGYNLSRDNGGGFLTQAGDLINTNPLLGPLQNNGGPTFTHALLPGSPAIDRTPFFSAREYDQRGCPFLRVFNGRIDVGSFESQPPPPPSPPCPTPRPRPTPAPR